VRRFFFILMIVLLPLRGWVGDAMAMQMVLPGGTAHASATVQSHGAEHAHSGVVADHRHATHAADCSDHPDRDAAALDAHCQTCTVCQTCHTVAITVPVVVAPGAQAMAALPPLVTDNFISADRGLSLKPPIS
jgi:hypothetical protein